MRSDFDPIKTSLDNLLKKSPLLSKNFATLKKKNKQTTININVFHDARDEFDRAKSDFARKKATDLGEETRSDEKTEHDDGGVRSAGRRGTGARDDRGLEDRRGANF